MTARITLAHQFPRIARENLKDALVCEQKLKVLRTHLRGLTGDEASEFQSFQLDPLDDKQATHCLIAIVFAALAVEAQIHDYASRKLGDTFVTEHLERLDPIRKLAITTKVVTGEDFPKGGRAFQSLRQLIKNRNYIVHSKSAPIVPTESPSGLGGAAERMLEFDLSILENAQKAIQASDELFAVMQKLDPDEPTWLSFDEVAGKHEGARQVDSF